MLFTLAFRQLMVKRGRGLVLLLGFALGVGVMLVLLSVGEAMLAQSRDTKLVGGGEVTVLPQGIDIEAMRTGGISGLFFGIDRARFVTRQFVGGPRTADLLRGAAPALEQKLLYLGVDGTVRPVRVGGELPSRAAMAGAKLDVREGRWADSPADSAWLAPTPQQLYDEMDRFHLPMIDDSTWGEWHYFNVVTSPDEWWYVTYLVGGRIGRGRWGGQLLVTHRMPDGQYERFSENVDGAAVALDTTRADLRIGNDSVMQRNGIYSLRGTAGALRFSLEVRPKAAAYFPPVELRDDADFLSGYVVPGLVARASGEFCVRGRCLPVLDAAAYHDHNWGVWRDVTWEWGAGQGSTLALLYGGVYAPGDAAQGRSPFFFTLVDALGVRQVLRFTDITWSGSMAAGGDGGVAPAAFTLIATRDADTVRLTGRVRSAQSTRRAAGGYDRAFVQLRAGWQLSGRLAGRAVADTGSGFFETHLR
jgi:hypothetical protein